MFYLNISGTVRMHILFGSEQSAISNYKLPARLSCSDCTLSLHKVKVGIQDLPKVAVAQILAHLITS